MAPKKRSALQLEALEACRAKKMANAAARLAARADDEQDEPMQIVGNAAGVPVLHALIACEPMLFAWGLLPSFHSLNCCAMMFGLQGRRSGKPSLSRVGSRGAIRGHLPPSWVRANGSGLLACTIPR